MTQKQVFLGGTCNGSTWRETLKPKLTINYFDPVVPNWNEAAQKEEIEERENCDYCLYYITPKMTGVYAIAEAVDDSNKRPSKVVFYFEDEAEIEFSHHQYKSLTQTGKMIEANGGKWARCYDELLDMLNRP